MTFVEKMVRAVLFLDPPPPTVPPAAFDPVLSDEVTRTTSDLHKQRGFIHSTMQSVRDSADELTRLNDAVLGRNKWH